MSALKDLRLFVHLCQIIGLLPYSMELDPETKAFRRFRFSIKSIPAWLYVIALAAQVAGFIFAIVLVLRYYISDGFSDLHLPIVVVLLNGSTQFIYIFFQIFKRGIVLRYQTLGRVVSLIKEVDRHLMNSPECKNTVHRRTIIGFFFAIFLVGSSFTAAYSSLKKRFTLGDQSEFTMTIAYLVFGLIQIWMTISLWFSFIFMHLSYYITSFYIRLLKFTLSKNLPFATQTADGQLSRIKKSQCIFNDLCRAIIELNRVFSYPALLIITTKLVTFLNGLFMIIYQIIKPGSNVVSGGLWTTSTIILTDLIMILVYIISADIPIQQVRLLRENLIRISNAHMEADIDYRIEVMSLMVMMEEDRIRLTGVGLFKVGIHLIPPLTASLITYLIILIQTQLNTSHIALASRLEA